MDPSMVDPGFPDAHTTTTTTTTTRVQTNLRFDPSYMRTIPGILKIVQLITNAVGYFCVKVSLNPSHSRSNWFGFVAGTGFFVTAVLLGMYLMHAIEKLHMVPWLKVELGYTALWSFFSATSSTACAVWGGYVEAWAAAAFFGYVAMIAYAVDAYFKFKGWRSGDIAQGDRSIQVGEQVMQSQGAF